MRAFSRVHPAQNALKEYRESIKTQFTDDGTPFRLATSRDSQRTRGTNGDYTPASEQSIKSLDKELKEPAEIVFFEGGVYECTINDTRDGQYCQSQLAFMLELPSQDAVDRFNAIPLWIAPPATHHINFDRNNMPSREELNAANWVEVRIGCTPERLVPARYGIQAKRLQYSLKHIGAITINKAQGATLPLGLAVEISEEFSPWEVGQIVVALSRSMTSDKTIIVGERKFSIQKMWELMTTFDQWTQYTERVLDVISVNREEVARNQHIFDYPEVILLDCMILFSPLTRQDSYIAWYPNSTWILYILAKQSAWHRDCRSIIMGLAPWIQPTFDTVRGAWLHTSLGFPT